MVGERWTLLVPRELLLGPRRFRGLLDGLAGIGPNLALTLSTTVEPFLEMFEFQQRHGALLAGW